VRDDLGVHLRITGGRVTAIRFDGHGCALAISAASYASQRYVGLSIAEISSLTADCELGLLPVHVPAIREPCAVLHLRAVLAALAAGTGQPSATQRNVTEAQAGGVRADLLQGSRIRARRGRVRPGLPPMSGGPAAMSVELAGVRAACARGTIVPGAETRRRPWAPGPAIHRSAARWGTWRAYQPAACRLRACVNSLRELSTELAGPIRGGRCAERMRSIVMQARDAAGRAGLCATPSAAGQVPAVPPQAPALDRDCHFVFTGARPHANWGRACPPVRCVRCAAAIRQRGS
jgi:NifU-like N terminal domain